MCGSGLAQQDRAKIVDVGERRAGSYEVFELFEEAITVIVFEGRLRVDAQVYSSCERIRGDDRAGIVLAAIDAIGIGGDGVDIVGAAELDGKRQQKLDIATAPAFAFDGPAVRAGPPQRHALAAEAGFDLAVSERLAAQVGFSDEAACWASTGVTAICQPNPTTATTAKTNTPARSLLSMTSPSLSEKMLVAQTDLAVPAFRSV